MIIQPSEQRKHKREQGPPQNRLKLQRRDKKPLCRQVEPIGTVLIRAKNLRHFIECEVVHHGMIEFQNQIDGLLEQSTDKDRRTVL